jgi:hypothetical protein
LASNGIPIPGQSVMVSTAMFRLWWSVTLPFFDSLWALWFADAYYYQDVTPEAAKDTITPLNATKLAPGEGTPKLPDIPPTEDDGGKGGNEGAVPKPSPEDDFAMLAKRFEALKKRWPYSLLGLHVALITLRYCDITLPQVLRRNGAAGMTTNFRTMACRQERVFLGGHSAMGRRCPLPR